MQNNPVINPYNFVPLDETKIERSGCPGLRSLGANNYSGQLICHLVAISPLFSAHHQSKNHNSGEDTADAFSFLTNSQGNPIIQGTSLKGMVRSVYEAITHSCLPLAAISGEVKMGHNKKEYSFGKLGKLDHNECKKASDLCPACRLWGVIKEDEVNVQGRIIFSDAVFDKSVLVSCAIFLPELSTPKPYHYPIYSKTGKINGPIAGRKFYYHHNPNKKIGLPAKPSKRAKEISSYIPASSQADFSVSFSNIDEPELALLVHSLELEEGLAHKIGMAKSIGLGSCRIEIDFERSNCYKGSSRYDDWNMPAKLIDLEDLRAKKISVPSDLVEILRLNKFMEGTIGYLSYSDYKSQSAKIDAKGRYSSHNSYASKSGSSGSIFETGNSITSLKEVAHQAKLPKKVEEMPERTEKEKVTLATNPIDGKAQVRTKDKEEISCAKISPYIALRIGETFWAKVTRRGDKVIRAVFHSQLR
jgi:CRISPR/Cas system CSM-associated protein Csm3 (group 7 of RAMP superfamily)